jgi:hypothetical protein
MSDYKVYYEKHYYEFDGVNWTPIKSRFDEPIQTFKGPKIEWHSGWIYCPYIPKIVLNDSSSK